MGSTMTEAARATTPDTQGVPSTRGEGVHERFARAAERFGPRVAVERLRHQDWSYDRIQRQAEALSAALAAAGIGPGDRCALLAENDARWCAAFFAVLRLGAVVVPLDTTYTPEQVARVVEDSGARMIAVSPRFAGVVERARGAMARPCPMQLLGPDDATERSTDGSCVPVQSGDPAVILYTSGTTSDPKGVVLTHANLLAEIDAAIHAIPVTDDDAVLGVLPLFHSLALVANLLLPLTVGARVVFLDNTNSAELLRALRERGITVFCCVPQFFYLIHQRVMEQVGQASWARRNVFRALLLVAGALRERVGINLGRRLFARVHRVLGPRMRLLVTGGSRFDPRIGRDLYRLGFNILQAYGLTETSGAATVLRPNDRRIDSVGQALPGIELKIVPGEESGDGSTGEIAIRGPIVTSGYYRRDDVNARVLRDGWLYTGDLGHLDEDGRLYVTGRAKDVIVLGSGKNIYPEEIEAHYARSPCIKELCVMGRTLPGAPATERLHAIVVPDFDVLRERKVLNSREIMRFEIESLSAQLPGHKRILSYDVVSDELPRTTTRKLKRFEIERAFAAAKPRGPAAPSDEATDSAWLADPHVQRVVDLVRAEVREAEAMGPDSNLELDLGLDSMQRVELLASLETRCGVTIPDDVAHAVFTVGELVEALRPSGGEPRAVADLDVDPWRKLLDDAPADDPALAATFVARPWLSLLLFAIAKTIYGVAWLLLGLRVTGREHLPRSGPYLISPNHQSFLDAFLLASVLPYRTLRDVFYVGASEYFATPFSAWCARMIHLVPVDPDTNLVRAMRASAAGLRRGRILILFPEGERSIDAEVKQFKKGAAILAQNVQVPIVPVGLEGLFDIWPRDRGPRLMRLLPFGGTRVRIRFGAPLAPSAGRSPEDYAAVTARLREEIRKLVAGQRASAR